MSRWTRPRPGSRARSSERPGESLAEVERRIRWPLVAVVVVANVGGALVVLVFATVVLPTPSELADPERVQRINLVAFVAYLACAVPVGIAWGIRLFRPARRLVNGNRPPGAREWHVVLYGPLRLMVVHITLWGVGIVGWTVINAGFSALLALKVGLTCLLGAVTTCAVVYLLAERLLRSAAALALTAGASGRAGTPGVAPRSLLAWALGTAVPVLGLVLVAVAALAVSGFSTERLAVTVVVLSATALTVGVGVTYIAARAIADPLDSVRAGLTRVQQGDFEVEVPVYDASEVGMLQAGFNDMVAGLRERERLRDLFGRHVGEDVARGALDRGAALGGELREVTVVFVDLVDSTRLAATHAPGEVVRLLNTFFGVVVDVVEQHGGWVNKFEGDAALAVFGAPVALEDAPGRALAAARHLSEHLRYDVPQLRAGVGVSTGPVVAGNIGAERRFEYTVIGDAVNETARLADLAKNMPEGVLASAAALTETLSGEVDKWNLGEMVTLRGRTEPTRLATPADELGRPAAE